MDFLNNVIIGVLSNLIFWFGFGSVVWLVVLVSQSKFLEFFGCDKSRAMIVYLSNLWQPTADKPLGFVVSGHEFRVTKSISELFGSPPLRLPEFARGLIDNFWLAKKVDFEIVVSPVDKKDIVYTNMIIVGGASRNTVRKHYIEEASLITILEDTEAVLNSQNQVAPYVQIVKGHRKGERIDGKHNLAIIEKVYDKDRGTAVFMCNGVRGDGSWGATEYLVRHWSTLSRKYKDREFALCLGFPDSESYMDKYMDPIILARIPSE